MTLLTEQEARKKACHRTLFADIWSNPKENEGEVQTVWTPCIASECMAWRWQPKSGEGNYYPGHWKGYCGLAGKPEDWQ